MNNNIGINTVFLKSLDVLENDIKYQFIDRDLLLAALTHCSFGSNNYERLEFLGDSVLSVIISKYLYSNFDNLSEGELSRIRSNLVNQKTLSTIAIKLELHKYVLVGRAEKYGNQNPSILADVMESLIAAIFLDSGSIERVNEIVLELFSYYFKSSDIVAEDAKTKLQEIVQAKKLPLPEYEVIAEDGPPHNRVFTIKCNIDLLNLTATATAKTKKEAGQLVAAKIINMIYD